MPGSFGLGQVRWLYHQEAFDDADSIESSAYNVDYVYAVWRDCFDGNLTWLNNVEGRGDYVAGDAMGCTGVWFSGRWYTQRAVGYIANLSQPGRTDLGATRLLSWRVGAQRADLMSIRVSDMTQAAERGASGEEVEVWVAITQGASTKFVGFPRAIRLNWSKPELRSRWQSFAPPPEL